MDHQLLVKFKFGKAPKVLFQNGSFDLKLMLVIGVLIVAAATALKIRAWRRTSPWRSLQKFINSGACKA